MDECPRCELNKLRAANWRAEAYRLAGHDVIERPWVGLTIGDIAEIVKTLERGNFLVAIQNIETKLREMNT